MRQQESKGGLLRLRSQGQGSSPPLPKDRCLTSNGLVSSFALLALTAEAASCERLFRLLAQLRVRPAEIGYGGILADLDDAASDRAGAGEMLEQRLAVAASDRAGQLGEVLVKGAEHFQHRFLVGEEYVAPHDRVGGGDAGEVAKAAGRELDHLRGGHLAEFVGGADDGVG